MIKLNDIASLDKYPINELQSEKYKDLVKQYRVELDSTGCCSLTNFITQSSTIRMHNELNVIKKINTKLKLRTTDLIIS